MTEVDVQNLLYKRFCQPKRHRLCVPNTKPLAPRGESDLVSVTKAGLVHEFEIKISASDFKREFEDKKTKHQHFQALQESGDAGNKSYPNYFWMVVSNFENVMSSSKEPLPSYMGLIDASKASLSNMVLKKAPRLHSSKMDDRLRRYLQRGLTYRYWGQRLEFQG